ncbi:hypothetical protein GGQ71_003789 [Rhizobium taibaishanense]|uniref:Uncharacterized protein n=1 Tax=Allorhizobium taibaishanense TaxID=887144 RepID=A0A7W6HQD8_9HYPH|nr:hypothetical protein [Allorhizobium taibaishanense]
MWMAFSLADFAHAKRRRGMLVRDLKKSIFAASNSIEKKLEAVYLPSG